MSYYNPNGINGSKGLYGIGLSYSNVINPNDYYQKMNKYTELMNQGSKCALNKNNDKAIKYFTQALSIAKILNDEYKESEALCNIGIIEYYSGRMNESIDKIQSCYNYINSICQSEIGTNNIRNLYLLSKSGANLCMSLLTKNSKNSNCLKPINNIIDLLSKEEDIYKRKHCIKYLNNFLFKVDSLLIEKNDYFDKNYYNYKINIMNNNENIYSQINELFIKSFDNYIATNKIMPWIESLNFIYQKMEQLNEQEGIIYIIFNQQLAILLKNYYENNDIIVSGNDETNRAKKKLTFLLKSIAQIQADNNDNFYSNNINKNISLINEQYINNVIEDYKCKISFIRKIYQMLQSFEKEIIENEENYYNRGNINNNNMRKPNINSEYCLILLLKYTKKYFYNKIQDINLKTSLIKDIDDTLYLIESKNIDITQLNISSIDPEIYQSLYSIMNNLFSKYRYYKLLNVFRTLISYSEEIEKMRKIQIVKKEPKKYKYIEADNKKLDYFFNEKYKYIFKGENITKIAFNTKKKKNNFYQIDNENDYFQSFETNSSSKNAKHNYDFDDILKVQIGIKTKNLITKIKEAPEPYLYLSLVMRERSIDLEFQKEESAKNWFYGLYHYFIISKRPYKIGSCTSYILFRTKCKIIIKKKKGKINIRNINNIPFSSCMLNYLKNHNF